MYKIFDTKKVDQIARQTGFLKRNSKLTPQAFIDLMFYTASGEYTSLRNISVEAKAEHSLSISKQGLDSRFSAKSIDFSKKLLEEAIRGQVVDSSAYDASQLFNRVLIKDSTRFDITETLKEHFPGYGGDGSKAGVSIQFEFDIKRGEITDMDLQSELDRDSTDALNKKDKVEERDLIIRDLGYYSMDVIKSICSKKAYFISRLYHSVKVYKSKTEDLPIDFKFIYKRMQTEHLENMELNVFIGRDRFPMRLIICLLPEEIYEQRIRTRNKKNKSTGYNTSDEYKARAHFNLFLCNIESKDLSKEAICRFYRIRWQIELIFKTWKSLLKINCLGKMKYDRLVTTLYMNLLWVIVHWKIIIPFRNYMHAKEGRLLSHFKCMDTMAEQAKGVRRILRLSKIQIGKEIRKFFEVLSFGHWLEIRKERVSLEELYDLLFCKSAEY